MRSAVFCSCWTPAVTSSSECRWTQWAQQIGIAELENFETQLAAMVGAQPVRFDTPGWLTHVTSASRFKRRDGVARRQQDSSARRISASIGARFDEWYGGSRRSRRRAAASWPRVALERPRADGVGRVVRVTTAGGPVSGRPVGPTRSRSRAPRPVPGRVGRAWPYRCVIRPGGNGGTTWAPPDQPAPDRPRGDGDGRA